MYLLCIHYCRFFAFTLTVLTAIQACDDHDCSLMLFCSGWVLAAQHAWGPFSVTTNRVQTITARSQP